MYTIKNKQRRQQQKANHSQKPLPQFQMPYNMMNNFMQPEPKNVQYINVNFNNHQGSNSYAITQENEKQSNVEESGYISQELEAVRVIDQKEDQSFKDEVKMQLQKPEPVSEIDNLLKDSSRPKKQGSPKNHQNEQWFNQTGE